MRYKARLLAKVHGDFDEKNFMNQLKGFKSKSKLDQVCFIKKYLLGLKYSLRQWYKKFDFYVLPVGFK